MDYVLKSTMKMFPLEVYYNELSLTNIISLSDLILAKRVHISMDSSKDNGLHVNYKGLEYCFAPFNAGLYYYHTRVPPKNVNATATVSGGNTDRSVTRYSFLQTVNDNKSFYTDNEVKGAEKARL